ncbi:MAG: glycine cleavage system protein GcvH [Planctomycetota bacterium]
MNPHEIRYTESHEWARLENGIVITGITEYAAEQVGDIVFIEFEEDDEIDRGDAFGVLETVKAVFDLYAPVSGEILERNTELEKNPTRIKEEPYGKGWILKIKPNDEEELAELMGADEYEKFLEEQKED